MKVVRFYIVSSKRVPKHQCQKVEPILKKINHIARQIIKSHQNKPVVASKGSWLAQAANCRRLDFLLYPNHPQPEPWMATVRVVSSFLKFSKDPKLWLMASFNSADGSVRFGVKFCQKIVWLICPPPLNFKAPPKAIIFDGSFLATASASCSSAAFRLFT